MANIDLDRQPPVAADSPASEEREKFIPLRKRDLIRLLDDELPSGERPQFEKLCQLLCAVFNYEYHQRLDNLKDVYAPFDPDAIVKELVPTPKELREQKITRLFDEFAELLERANYVHLNAEEVHEMLDTATGWGVRLDLDPEVFQRVEFFVCGDAMQQATVRRWQRFFREELVEFPVYRRLVVIFRLRKHPWLPDQIDSEKIHIKIFKDIPHSHLTTLLPGARVKMTLLDRAKILLPTLSGVGVTIFKLVQVALALTVLTVYGVLAVAMLVGGALGYGVKSFFGFLRTKQKYQLNLTTHLYFQNLDNNAGVLFRLLDEAAVQEFREAILAYILLWKRAPAEGWTQSELDREAEAFLFRTVGIDVDFEIDDALQKLLRLELVERQADGMLRAVPIAQALGNLDRRWDAYFQCGKIAAPPPHTDAAAKFTPT